MTAGIFFLAAGLVMAIGSQWAKRSLDDKTNSFQNGYLLLGLLTVFGAGIGAALLGVAILIVGQLAKA